MVDFFLCYGLSTNFKCSLGTCNGCRPRWRVFVPRVSLKKTQFFFHFPSSEIKKLIDILDCSKLLTHKYHNSHWLIWSLRFFMRLSLFFYSKPLYSTLSIETSIPWEWMRLETCFFYLTVEINVASDLSIPATRFLVSRCRIYHLPYLRMGVEAHWLSGWVNEE